MIETQKFIRKPLYVDAVRVTAVNFEEIAAWCQGEVQQDEGPGQGTRKKYIKVRVHNPKNPRQTKAFVGDWLLYTERGYKVYTNKAFYASFDMASEEISSGLNETTPTEVILATPEGIAQAVQENDQARDEYPETHTIGGTPREDINVGIPAQSSTAEDKRVLSLEEQSEMDQEEIRELLKTGEVVLAQDLAA